MDPTRLFSSFLSKQHQLFRIFSGASATLIRKMYNITILSVGKIQDLDIALFWQISFDVVDPGLKRLLAVYEAGVDRKLAALKTLVEQEIAKIRGCLALWLGVGWQVEHHEYPHDPVS